MHGEHNWQLIQEFMPDAAIHSL